MTVADINSITGLYVTYYGRAADQSGLEFWVTESKKNPPVSLEAMATGFAGVQESRTKYPYLANPNTSDPTAFVTSIYVNAFGRQPEAAGLAFWVNELRTKGSAQAPTFILTVLLNAQGTDFTALQNKANVAKRFSDGLISNNITPTAQIFTDSTTILNTITDAASVTAGNTSVDQKIAGYVSGGTVGTSVALTTSGADNLVGTAGNDTFVGGVDATVPANNTLQVTDKIDGGAGTDTLIYTGYLAGGIFPSVSNVENIQLLNVASINLNNIDLTTLAGKGVQQVTLVTPVAGPVIASGLSGITFGIQGATLAANAAPAATATFTSVTPSFGTTATSASVSIRDAVFTTLDISGSTAVNTLNIAADGLGKNSIGTLTAATTVKTVNISGAGTLTIGTPTATPAGTVLPNVTTINASTNTGGVGIASGALTGTKVTITGGSGNDTLLGGNDADTITGGAGSDILTGGSFADILTGGAGKDTFTYGVITTTDSTGGTLAGTVSFDTITDFAVADDTLKLASLTASTSLVTQTTVQNAVAGLSGTPTFTQVLNAAAGAIGGGKFGAFVFGSNTYVLGVDTGTPAVVDASDQLIALTGSLVLTNTNFGF